MRYSRDQDFSASMRDVTRSNFGLLIAYVLPGFTVLWGIGHVFPTIQAGLGASSTDAPTIGGFLYGTLAAVGAGMTVSTLRWLVIDAIHHGTGLRQPRWDFARLQQNVTAFDTLIEIHYRYYQFYANMLVAVVIAAALRWSEKGMAWIELLPVAALVSLFFVGSRDTLRKYYSRVAGVLSSRGSVSAKELADQIGLDLEGPAV